MTRRRKLVVALASICLVDLVVPVPILGLVLVYVVLARPPWFLALTREVYAIDG